VLSIVLGDRHPLFQEAVRSVLEDEPELRVVATAGDGNRAILEAERHRPHVALLSANLMNCDGFSATALIRSRVPSCRVVILAGDRNNAALARAIEAGASGYLPQDCPLPEVIAAIHAVHRGDVLIPPNMLGDLIERLAGRANGREQGRRLLSALTKREREILLFLTRGADNDAMAEELFISPQTARTHVQNVLAKLGVHSRLEAIAFVNRNALLDDLELSGTRPQGRPPSPADSAGTLAHRNRWVAAGRTAPRKSPAAPMPGGTPISSRAPEPGVAVRGSK
jgi:DNA-binding NarL/FixJ family response regulator